MPDENDSHSNPESEKRQADRRRLKILYMGLGLYLLIIFNGFRYAARVPYQALIAAGVLNMAIVITIVMAIVKVRRRLIK